MSEFDDLELIKHVRNFSYIYDRTHPNYKNKVAKQNAWKSIGIILGKYAEDCEQRWSVLRTRYNTEVRLMSNKIPGSDFRYLRKWHLLDDMSFLADHIIKRKTKGYSAIRTECMRNLTQFENNYSSNADDISFVEESTEIKTECVAENLDFGDTNESNQVRASNYEDSPQCSTPPHTSPPSIGSDGDMRIEPGNNKGEMRTKIDDTWENTLNTTVQSFNSYFRKKEEETENADMCFSKYVYYSLLDIRDIKKRNKIKLEITRLFLEAQEYS